MLLRRRVARMAGTALALAPASKVNAIDAPRGGDDGPVLAASHPATVVRRATRGSWRTRGRRRGTTAQRRPIREAR